MKIKHLKFVIDELTVEAKGTRKSGKDYCLMEDYEILDIKFLKALKKRIQFGIEIRELKKIRMEND